MSSRVTLIVVISVGLSFLLLFLFLFVHTFLVKNLIETPFNKSLVEQERLRNKIFQLESKFVVTNGNSTKKLFILGSSHVHYLNTTQIQNQLLQNNEKFEVHNLSRSGDHPSYRLEMLDLIIKAKPSVVVYGIAYRDLEDTFNEWQYKENKFPSPDEYFYEIIKPIRKTITTYFNDNPKFVTLSVIKNIVQEDDVDLSQEQNYLLYPDEFVPYPNSYFTIAPYNVNVKSDEELKQHFLIHGASFKGLGSPSKNEKVIALKQIINTLHNNNVKVIVFTTPHSKYYLDAMPENEKISFKNTLKSIEHDTGVKIHSLEEKYRDLELWNDPDHVALTHNKIFGDDVTKIILDEMES